MKFIFIIGNSRSGTKMIGNVLNQSNSVYTIEHEIHFFEELCSIEKLSTSISKEDSIHILIKLLSVFYNGYLNSNKFSHTNLEKLIPEAEKIYDKYIPVTCALTYKAFLQHLIEVKKVQSICETTPRNQFFIADIKAIFGDPKLIYLYRDPRAVLYSQKKKWKANIGKGRKFEILRNIINYHPITISLLWRASIKNYLKNKNQVYSIKYENFVENPEKELKDLAAYLTIEFDIKMLKIKKTNSSLVKNKTGIYSASKDAWNKGLNSAEKYICYRITKDYLSWLGYKKSNKNNYPNILYIIFYLVYFPIHLSLVYIMNFKRYKNFFHSLKIRLK